jgi:hypothetical protein
MFTDGRAARRSIVCALALALIASASAAAQAPPSPPVPPPPAPEPVPPPAPEPDPHPPVPPEPPAPAAHSAQLAEEPLPLGGSGAVDVAAPGSVAPSAPSGLPAAEREPDDGEPPPLRLPFTLQTSVGQGSFVADEHARNAYFGYSLAFAPSYAPSKDISIGLLVAMSQELTDSDIDTERQQVLLSDTRLSGSFAFGKIPTADIGVTGQARLFLPSSLASQHQTLVLGTGLLLALSRELGPVSLGLATSFRKNFHRYSTPVLDGPQAVPVVNPRAGSAEGVEDHPLQQHHAHRRGRHRAGRPGQRSPARTGRTGQSTPVRAERAARERAGRADRQLRTVHAGRCADRRAGSRAGQRAV